MRFIILFQIIAFILFLPLFSSAQNSENSVIRRLEDRERRAIFNGDTIELSNLMSKKIIVHNPENTIVGLWQIIDRIKGGKISYSSFERKIDTIAILNDMAVVMGLETIMPQGNTQNVGKTVRRRFTNIWTKENGNWKLIVRQATIISISDNSVIRKY